MSGTVDRRAFLVSAGSAAAALSGRKRPRAVPKGSHPTLERAIRGHVFRPGASGYRAASQVYNERFDSILPQAVARPLDAPDVLAAVQWALAGGVQVRARSGGHSYAGYSTFEHGVVLDLRKLNSVSVNRGSGTATVGAGAQLIDVYRGLAAHGATIPAGSCPSVGIAGVTLGGGVGLAARQFGLTLDNLTAVQIVTADGALYEVDSHHDPDLFWALRGGGGGNFGVATSFTFRLHPLPPAAAWFIATFPWSRAAEAISRWLEWAPHADQRLTSILHLNGAGVPSASVAGQFLGPLSALAPLLAPLLNVSGTSIVSGAQDYLGLQLRWAGCLSIGEQACHTVGAGQGGTLPRASFDAKSDYLTKTLPVPALEVLTEAVQARAGARGTGAILFDSYGGVINRVAPDATAFVHRQALCAIQYLSYGGDDAWLGSTWQRMRPYVSGEAYQNYIDAALPDWQTAYYARNYHRLRQVRQAVDPHHFFSFPQAIE